MKDPRLDEALAKATSSWKQLGAALTISGVGCWDKPHTQNPHAPNFAELYAVTAVKFISGRAARRDASDYEAHFELGHSAHCVDQGFVHHCDCDA
jgi:hypothetical protein